MYETFEESLTINKKTSKDDNLLTRLLVIPLFILL